jgi:hypothetical protein
VFRARIETGAWWRFIKLASQRRSTMKLRQPMLFAAATLLALSGCAAVYRQEAADAEALLESAGFQKRHANRAELAKMLARQLVARDEAGKTVYTFADPDRCNCVYSGGQKEYGQLQQLRQARIADHEWTVRHSSSTAVAPDLWSPWNPEGLEAK